MKIKLAKVFMGDMIKEIDEEERTLTIVASTGERDRVNEEIPPSEWKLDNYNKNPVIMWAHNYGQPPVAKALWTKADKTGLKQKIQFAKTAFAQDIFELYKGGFLNAFSVGFRAERDEKDQNIFRDAELLEVSCVPVPCNASALAERSLAYKAFEPKIKTPEAVDIMKKVFEVKAEEVIEPELEVELEIEEPVKATATELEKDIMKELEDCKAENEVLKRSFDELLALKEGRVLSTKNRELIGKCVTMLKELMDATEPEERNIQEPSEKIENQGIIVKDKTNDEPTAESLADAIKAAVKQADVQGLVRSELKRMKGEVE
jgi:HK97 family phage prohead protease